MKDNRTKKIPNPEKFSNEPFVRVKSHGENYTELSFKKCEKHFEEDYPFHDRQLGSLF